MKVIFIPLWLERLLASNGVGLGVVAQESKLEELLSCKDHARYRTGRDAAPRFIACGTLSRLLNVELFPEIIETRDPVKNCVEPVPNNAMQTGIKMSVRGRLDRAEQERLIKAIYDTDAITDTGVITRRVPNLKIIDSDTIAVTLGLCPGEEYSSPDTYYGDPGYSRKSREFAISVVQAIVDVVGWDAALKSKAIRDTLV